MKEHDLSFDRRSFDRRSFLALTAAAAGYGLVGPALETAQAQILAPSQLSSPRKMRLWKGKPPGGGGPDGPIEVSKHGAVSNVAIPTIDIYMPAKPNGAAALVAAGGGYKRIEMENEAVPAAHWLNQRGIIACVLTYRLPDEDWRLGALAPLQDAQRALRLMHAGEVSKSIDPKKIGVLGFSAGGHLMGMAATRTTLRAYRAVDDADRASDRTAFCALAYPIISLKLPHDHTSTRRVLIGRHPSWAGEVEWSVETHVRKSCPPVFLVQAADDRISNPKNTAIMEEACQKEGIPVERHLLASGGHGFGMGKPGTPTAEWPAMFDKWLKARKII